MSGEQSGVSYDRPDAAHWAAKGPGPARRVPEWPRMTRRESPPKPGVEASTGVGAPNIYPDSRDVPFDLTRGACWNSLAMDFDITSILENWDYKPGQVMVRKFKARDGRELIQLRVDLGLLQLNADGRPDGKRPMGHESWFDFQLSRLEEHRLQHEGDDEGFSLTTEDCSKLHLESIHSERA